MTVDLDMARIVDEQAIVNVCLRYGQALDQKDWEALRDCFVSDAVAEYEGIGACHGVDEIIALVRNGLQVLDRSQHLLTNFLIEVDGDRATSACYLQAQHVRSGTPGGSNFIIAGRYTDDVVRRPEGWRIALRRLEIWWTDGNQAVIAQES
jgi:hypothetical protein